MIPIVCLDDQQGMMFNHRRQSMDECLRKDLIDQITPNKLWMNEYSLKQFKDTSYDNMIVHEQFLELAQLGEYCFVENQFLSKYLDRIEKIIVYRWNRIYPADMKFDLDLSQPEWKRLAVSEFQGKSHPIISKEVLVYEK
ncbi:MAG: ribonuclease Z [Clostridiales bacterium]|nr:ribonuclease Z [Clostridiales bacterium]